MTPKSSLELKIPPPVVAVAIGMGMWVLSRMLPHLTLLGRLRLPIAIALGVLGMCCTLAAVASFRRVGTTVNPTRPQDASLLVAKGIYRITRNPMYLGLALILVAWAVWLASAWALLGPALFVAYMTRFQIIPEERALVAKFGAQFSQYAARVRRWL